MLCAKCRKNQATKTYEQIKKGKKEISYYCLDCYHNTFLCDDERSDAYVYSACPYCGTTAEEFKKRNLVGCAYCYETLQRAVYPVIRKMQGGELHRGKAPYENEREKTERRCLELKTLAEKRYREGDKEGAAEYEEQISRLRAGDEEEYAWRSRISSKRS
ncbi:MAG: hypothetical protein IJX91_05745 [Clostridia bacterium]|nr:hypothetical protein [Clostridia bacterium]